MVWAQSQMHGSKRYNKRGQSHLLLQLIHRVTAISNMTKAKKSRRILEIRLLCLMNNHKLKRLNALLCHHHLPTAIQARDRIEVGTNESKMVLLRLRLSVKPLILQTRVNSNRQVLLWMQNHQEKEHNLKASTLINNQVLLDDTLVHVIKLQTQK